MGSSAVPLNQATNAIPQPDTIGISFDKSLFAGVVGTVVPNQSNNVLLLDGSIGYAVVPSRSLYSPTTNTIYLTPTAILTKGHNYMIRVAGKDLGLPGFVSDDQGFGAPGNALASTVYDGFTVKSD